MQIPPTFEQQKKPSDKGYIQYLTTVLIRMWQQLANVVNYGIQLYNLQSDGSFTAANIKGYAWTGNLAAGPNTITHNLGYTPRFVISTYYNTLGVVYILAVNNSTITVNSNVPGQANLFIA